VTLRPRLRAGGQGASELAVGEQAVAEPGVGELGVAAAEAGTAKTTERGAPAVGSAATRGH
jgi:hypothetical protein